MNRAEIVGGRPDLLDTSEAAAFLSVKKSTLEHYRLNGIGPKFCRIGPKVVRYHRRDLLAFLEGCSTE